MMKIYKPVISIAALILTIGCTTEEKYSSAGSNIVEISAGIAAPATDTRSTIVGDAFTADDVITLYTGTAASENTEKSTYKYSIAPSNTWSGTPGLFWDNMDRKADVGFTGILSNGGTLSLAATNTNTFSVQTAQNKDSDYLKSDLLIAYGKAKYDTQKENRTLTLHFTHVFAHFVINIVDQTADLDEGPFILDDKSVIILKGVKTKSTVTFGDPTTDAPQTIIGLHTDAAPTSGITTRKIGFANKAYSCEAILPAQDMSSAITLEIKSNINQKTYIYDLSNATITNISDKADMLKQGLTTTLTIKIKKTEITGISAVVTPWIESSASAEGTPDDYPVVEVGDNAEGGKVEITTDNDSYAGKTIKLTSDIEASDLSKCPIGTKEKPFRGTFDGQGYTIRNVSFCSASGHEDKKKHPFLGIFGYTEGATIINVNIEGVDIENLSTKSNTATGILIGYAGNSRIENCHVIEPGTAIKGNFRNNRVQAAYDNVGGLIGYAAGNTSVSYCSSTASVNGAHDYAGGLIGLCKGTSDAPAGQATVSECFATGAVNKDATKGHYIGGLIGYTRYSHINYCYAWGNVGAVRYIGGLIGQSDNTVPIVYCYAAGEVINGETKAGLIGYTETPMKQCYWNAKAISTSTTTDGAHGCTPDDTNSSFTLTTEAIAMTTVLKGLNTEATKWSLTTGTAGSYSLPGLSDNAGKATTTNLVKPDEQK